MKRIGERLLMVAGVIAIPALLIQTYQWWNEPRGSLIADVRFGPFAAQPGYSYAALQPKVLLPDSLVRGLLRDTKIIDAIPEDARADVAFFLASELHRVIEARLPAGLPLSAEHNAGYWMADVRNDGTQALTSVVLSLPTAGYACMGREAMPRRCAPADSLRAIGDLQPRDAVRIVAWSPSEPAQYDVSRIRLTHESGIGKVNVLTPLSRNVVPQWLLLLMSAVGAVAIGQTIRRWLTLSPEEKGAHERLAQHMSDVARGAK